MCAKCGGATKTKMAKGGSMKTTVGSKSAKSFIAGIPNGGPTGPNYQGVDTMKKGGATKKKVDETAKKITSNVMKKGGSTGDKKWIQKAINPAHKGYCTPMSKPTCTPKRKALAITLKKMAKKK